MLICPTSQYFFAIFHRVPRWVSSQRLKPFQHFLVTKSRLHLWLGTLTELVSGLVIALGWVEVGNVFPIVVCLFFFFFDS